MGMILSMGMDGYGHKWIWKGMDGYWSLSGCESCPGYLYGVLV